MADRAGRVRELIEGDYRAFFEQLCNIRFDGKRDTGWCGFHPDASSSFSVYEADGGRIKWKCHAGCGQGDVFDAYQRAAGLPEGRPGFSEALRELEAYYGISEEEKRREYPGVVREQPKPVRKAGGGRGGGLPPGAKCTNRYPYRNAEGHLLYEVLRYEYPTENGSTDKTFRQRRPDPEDPESWVWNLRGIDRVPYRLPRVLKSPIVFMVEGEKDVETLEKWGLVATTTSCGAENWRPEFATWFAGKKVIIIPDRDPDQELPDGRVKPSPGLTLAAQQARDLYEVADAVKLWLVPLDRPKADVTDWVEAGGTKEQLFEAIRGLEAYDPVSPPDWLPILSEKEPEHAEDAPEGDRTPDEPAREDDARKGEPEPLSDEDPLRELLRVGLTPGDPKGRLIALRQKLSDLTRKGVGGKRAPKIKRGTDLFFGDKVEDFAWIVPGPPTGFTGLDLMIHGVRSAWIVVEGMSGYGKSTLVNQIVQNSAEVGRIDDNGDEQPFPWLIIPFEDSPEAWQVMMLARMSDTDGNYIATGKYPSVLPQRNVEEEIPRMRRLQELLFWPDRDEVTLIRLEDVLEMIEDFQEAVGYGCGGVVIDPIHAIYRGEEKEYDFLERATAALQAVGRRFNIPIITNTHYSKKGEAKGTSRFVFGADIRLQLSVEERAKRLNEGLPEEDRDLFPFVDLTVLKNKGGRTGRFPLRYHKPTSNFMEVR